ncbi:hypothetical protein V8G54_014317 [Vigna mungo]|uniref:Uncharacterized protein n=1 Tax=Vigna mungo TaxID=3915 RepID=A0AAQ3NJC5_VIGMU
MGGRWKTFSLFYNRLTTSSSSSSSSFSKSHFLSFNRSLSLAAAPSEIPDPDPNGLSAPDIDPTVKIPVKAYFLSTRYPTILSYSSSILSMAPFAILVFCENGSFSGARLCDVYLLLSLLFHLRGEDHTVWELKFVLFSFNL